MWRRMEVLSGNPKLVQKPTTRRIPRWSPSQVLHRPAGLDFGDRARTGTFPVVWS